MPLTQITDHAERALDRLAAQFRDKPRIAAILNALSAEVQEVENMLFDLLNKRSIDGGEGVQLDKLGTIVGQPRRGRTDAEYRPALRARIRINLAQGQPNEIIAAIKFATDATYVRLYEFFPASFLLDFTGTVLDTPDLLNIFRSVKPAGVLGWLVWTATNPFTLSLALAYGADGVRASDDSLTSATALFLTRGVLPGDILNVYIPQTQSGERAVLSVESETKIHVTPAFTVTDVSVDFDVRRHFGGGGLASVVATGADGATAGSPNPTATFTSATATFVTDGVVPGNTLVVAGVGEFVILAVPGETTLTLTTAALAASLSGKSYAVLDVTGAGEIGYLVS